MGSLDRNVIRKKQMTPKASNYFALTICFLFLLFFILADPASAGNPIESKSKINFDLQIDIPGLKLDGDNFLTGDAIALYVKYLYQWLVRAAAVLALAVLTFGGLMWIVSRGDKGKIGESQKIMTNALVGLLLALGSYAFLYAINPQLVTVNKITLRGVEPLKADDEITLKPTTETRGIVGSSKTHKVRCYIIKALEKEDASSPLLTKGFKEFLTRSPAYKSVTEEELKKETALQLGKLRTDALLYFTLNACPVGTPQTLCNKDNVDSTALLAAYHAGVDANKMASLCPDKLAWACEKDPTYQGTRAYVTKINESLIAMAKKGGECGTDTIASAVESEPPVQAASLPGEFATGDTNIPTGGTDAQGCSTAFKDNACAISASPACLFEKLSRQMRARSAYAYETCPLPQIPLQKQSDAQWADESYGGCGTIRDAGCAPSSVSMVVSHYGGASTPLDVAKAFAQNGFRGCSPKDCSKCEGSKWAGVTSKKVLDTYGLTGNQIPKSAILNYLKKDEPVVVVVGESAFADKGHFIVLTGIDPDTGNILINDPFGPDPKGRCYLIEKKRFCSQAPKDYTLSAIKGAFYIHPKKQ